jgi:hypothetical protein
MIMIMMLLSSLRDRQVLVKGISFRTLTFFAPHAHPLLPTAMAFIVPNGFVLVLVSGWHTREAPAGSAARSLCRFLTGTKDGKQASGQQRWYLLLPCVHHPISAIHIGL